MTHKYDFSNMAVVPSNKKVPNNTKNFYKASHLAGLVEGKIEDLAEVRFYDTGKTTTVVLWIHSPVTGLYLSNFGKVGGGGYNREKAAFHEAIRSMGITELGYYGIEDFLEELAENMGIEVFTIIESVA